MAQTDELSPLQKAYATLKQLRGKVERLERAGCEPIAIVGLGCRMPGARDPDAFWELIRDGGDAITEIPPERWDVDACFDPERGRPGKSYTRHGGFLDGVELFDAAFFGISGREAESMDPQQRLLLEVAWEALEHAGLPPRSLAGSATGVFVGVTSADYGMIQVERADESRTQPYFNTGTPLNACAGRVSYVLGLQGPCLAVDTACSSSLTAIHLACASLRARECDQALAGGVNLILTPRLNITLSAAGMMAPDGRCKTFDDAADGYVRGEGCGLVVLKRQADAEAAGDTILALIRGSGVNQDGASSGFTVPNGVAQQKLIRETLSRAKVGPDEIDYVEAHGTGTALGDPIEAQALGEALGRAAGRGHPLLVGSVKSNIGHLESAAGVAGLIKLVQALRHGELPPTLHLRQPNRNVAWGSLNLRPVAASTPWPRGGKRRLAGLSSFGASGSNAHLIIEEAPEGEFRCPEIERPTHVLALSGKSEPALRALADAFRRQLDQDPPLSLADFCYSANTGRSHFKQRLALCASTPAQARERLAAFASGQAQHGLFVGGGSPARAPSPVFLFSGQGSVYPGMGRDLYERHPGFRRTLDACAEILDPSLERPLLSVLFADGAEGEHWLGQAEYAQPALFALQCALAGLWRSFGLEPSAVAGHSLGEYAAACAAGVFGLEDGLRLVAERARLMQSLPQAGGMAAVFADERQVSDALLPFAYGLSLAVLNGPRNVVVSGQADALDLFLANLGGQGIETRRLHVTHAFHSPLMDPLLDAFERYARSIEFRAPEIPFVSNLTGRFLAQGEIPDAAYWRRHCREPVLFGAGLASLLARDSSLFVEIGPGPVLANLGKRVEPAAAWLPSLVRQHGDWAVVSETLAEAYARGAEVDWAGFDAAFPRNRMAVPTYPFQRKPYWIIPREPTMTNDQHPVPALSDARKDRDERNVRREAILARLLQLFSGLLRIDPSAIDIHAQFLEMGADSLVLVEGVRVVEDNFGVKLEIRQFFEEITSIDALAGYLAERAVAGGAPLAPAPVAQSAAAIARPAVSGPHTPAPAAAPVPGSCLRTEAIGRAAAAPAPALWPAVPLPQPAGGTAAERVMLAQMQLMAQQLAVLQGVPAGPFGVSAPEVDPAGRTGFAASAATFEHHADSQGASAGLANPVAPMARPACAAIETTPPAAAAKPAGDHSSPLRALAQPIVPAAGLTPRQSRHLAAMIDRYRNKTPKSRELAEACRPALADSRASIGFRFSTKDILYPITGVESMGSSIRDIDGNTYVDLTMGFGVLLFGSRPPFIQKALEAEIKRGFQLGPRSDLMLEITQLFTEMTGHERVAFTNSGTEAVMIALRLARTATGRDKIVIFEGSYHGHSDGTLAKTTRVGDELVSEPVAPGVPANLAKDILVLEYGTPETLGIIRHHAHELAAVLVEPVQSRRLDFQPVEFLRELRALTLQTGVTLIFDEMITGFRVHPGGIQGLYGIQADLAAYGKILGGGMPIGAVAGQRRLMDGIDGGQWQYGDGSYPSATRTYFGGTFCQHPHAMATCLAALRHLKAEGPALQERLNRRTAELAGTLNRYFREEGLPLQVTHFASVFRFEFSGNLELLYYHLLERGVYIWEWRACFLSTAHTDEDLALVVQAVKDSIEDLRQGGFLPQRGDPPDGGGKPAAGEREASLVEGGKPLETGARQALHASPTTAAAPAAADGNRVWFRHNSKLSHRETALPASPGKGGGKQRGMGFGLFYFGNYDAAFSTGKYDLLLEGARYADREGFEAVWIPERHFSEFGGFSPNPSVLAAALARETHRVALRAGSVVLPLHHSVRVAEEWALVDNLSDGRIGIGFASGWHPNDFVFAPELFGQHREATFEGMDTVRRLWRGETLTLPGGGGAAVPVAIFPRPKQAELPAWLTIVNNPDTYRKAGEMGVGVLTNLMGQSLEDLAKNIEAYRLALAVHGHDPARGNVSVLIHTYLCADAGQAVTEARRPMCDYLLSSIGLFQRMAQNLGPSTDIDRLTPADKDYIVGKAYEKYVATSALIGSPASVAPIIDRLIAIGVDELACFVDFGVPQPSVLAGLPFINELRKQYRGGEAPQGLDATAAGPQPSGFPLSEAQRQLWILAQLSASGSRAYNDPAALSLRGKLDREALRRAVEQAAARHEALRTRFDAAGGRQFVDPPGPLELPGIDLSEQGDPEARLRDWLLAKNQELFDFTAGPLFHPTLLKLAEDWHVLVLSAHHIASDGPSMAMVLEEIWILYAAARRGEDAPLPTPIQYRDFVRWQQEQAGTEAMAAHEAYWLGQFQDAPPALELPIDRPRPAVKTYSGAREWSEIGPALFAALRSMGAAKGCTPYMVLLAAYSALLHRISGQDRIVIGAPYTGRGLEGGGSLVGYCIHLLPVLSEAAGAVPFAEHLRRIRGTLLDAYQHQDYPFARLLDKLGLKRDISRSPLVETIFNLERHPGLAETAGLRVEVYPQPVAHARVDLTLTANLRDDRVVLECDYNTDLFDAASIRRLLGQYQTLLAAVAADPGQPLATLPLLSEPERRAQIVDWNRTEPAGPACCLHHLWEAQVARHPDRIALVDGSADGASFSYAELNRRANRLAHHLRGLGVGPDTRVGLCLERSPHLMVALLGTLKAGGAYVPMDPAYPAVRLAQMQADARVAVLLTQADILDRLAEPPRQVCCLDRDGPAIALESDRNPDGGATPDNLAYVIYTSGSTGRPKGAMIPHRGLVNYLEWAAQAYAVAEGDGAPVLGSIGFDATVTSLFVPLLAGCRVVLLPDGEELEALVALNRSPYRYSFVKLTPAHLEILNTLRATSEVSKDSAAATGLARYLVLGGEQLPGAALDPWFLVEGTVAVNEYGPTETVVGCCVYEAHGPIAGPVPIGRPIRGTRLYVLDRHLQPSPQGVPGELYIGGAGLARGYLERPGTTAAAFVPDPYAADFGEPGARLYKTGDRVRLLADGNLAFLGRVDRQVKLHGFRIELGEIEGVLAEHPAVRETAVLLREDQPGNPRLVAYATAASATEGQLGEMTAALRDWLTARLPGHMLPAAIVLLAEFPLTAHGKIDRAALPAPDPAALPGTGTGRAADYVPPRSGIERRIGEVWREALGVDRVGIHDNFFDLGGNSLLILQVYRQLGPLLKTDCPVTELFKYPTIASLATRLSGGEGAPPADYAVIRDRADRQKAAMSSLAAHRKVRRA
jgi:iturin family lipopeptide synthetase A